LWQAVTSLKVEHVYPLQHWLVLPTPQGPSSREQQSTLGAQRSATQHAVSQSSALSQVCSQYGVPSAPVVQRAPVQQGTRSHDPPGWMHTRSLAPGSVQRGTAVAPSSPAQTQSSSGSVTQVPAVPVLYRMQMGLSASQAASEPHDSPVWLGTQIPGLSSNRPV
jgi:hypothetical protein